MNGRRRGWVLGGWLVAAALFRRRLRRRLEPCGESGHVHQRDDDHAGAAEHDHLGSDANPGMGIHKIQHVVVIMQENRSFDTYFGTYPGRRRHPDAATAIPTVCVARSRDAATACEPYHDHRRRQRRRPARRCQNAVADIDGGKMDGFVAAARRARHGCDQTLNPACGDAAAVRTSWAITTARRSRTTGPTRTTSCSRTTCSSRTRPGACPRTCTWSPSGRRTARCRATPRAAATRSQHPGTPPDFARTPATATPTDPTTPGPTSPTCCTRTTSAGATTS